MRRDPASARARHLALSRGPFTSSPSGSLRRCPSCGMLAMRLRAVRQETGDGRCDTRRISCGTGHGATTSVSVSLAQ